MTEPIRILHMIGGLNPGGSQMFLMNLYRNIDRARFQFDFVLDHSEETYFVKEIEALGGRVFYVPRFLGHNVFAVRAAWDQLLSKHREYQVLHCHVRSYASLFLPIAKKYGLMTIIHSHSVSNGGGAKGLIKRVLQYPLRFQADRFLSCSMEAGVWLFGKKRCRSPEFFVIKNAIDSEQFRFDETVRERVRTELNLRQDAVIGFVGRMSHPKNPVFALHVFRELRERIPNVRLLLVGDGELFGEVRNEAENLGISDRVIMLGARTDVPELMCAMDLLLVPSLWEGFGISLLEAQTNGLFSLCSDTIPKLAMVTDDAEFLPLECGAQAWAQRAEEVLLQQETADRQRNVDTVKKSGFDISATVDMMTQIYLSK